MSHLVNYTAPSDLLEEANNQRKIMVQIAKAQRICNPFSRQSVEVQRLLLLAELKRSANKEELGNISIRVEGQCEFVTTVKINAVSLPLQPKLEKRMRKQSYVCVVSSGTKLFSSQLLQGSESIAFDDVLSFDKLSPNFALTISVHGLRKVFKRQKIKYNLAKEMRKIFKIKTDSRQDICSTSKFVLIGKCTLVKANFIEGANNFKLSIPADSPLSGRVSAHYNIYH